MLLRRQVMVVIVRVMDKSHAHVLLMHDAARISADRRHGCWQRKDEQEKERERETHTHSDICVRTQVIAERVALTCLRLSHCLQLHYLPDPAMVHLLETSPLTSAALQQMKSNQRWSHV